MLVKIGRALGKIEDHELSQSAAKVKVSVNGLEPIVKETIIEFDNGDEAFITLEYERLRNHCSLCNRLSHDDKKCPERRSPSRKETSPHLLDFTRRSGPHRALRSNLFPVNDCVSPRKTTTTTADTSQHRGSHLHHRVSRYNVSQNYNYQNSSNNRLRNDDRSTSARGVYSHHPQIQRSNTYSASRGMTRPARGFAEVRTSEIRTTPPMRPRADHSRSSQVWREKPKSKSPPIPSPSNQSRTRRPPLERDLNTHDFPPPPPKSREEIMEELRKTTLQYISVSDPTESAVELLDSVSNLQNSEILSTVEVPNLEIQKRKRGRPPLSSRLSFGSPKMLMGASGKKRKAHQVSRSPKALPPSNRTVPAKFRGEEVAATGESSKTTDPEVKSRKVRSDKQKAKIASENPPIRLIPPRTKEKTDFQDPSLP